MMAYGHAEAPRIRCLRHPLGLVMAASVARSWREIWERN